MPGAEQLLAGAGWLDNLFVYYAEEINNFSKQRQFLDQLRSQKFDLWIELPNDLSNMLISIRNMVLARLSGACWGYGWRINTVAFWRRAQFEKGAFPSETERLLKVVAQAGIEPGNVSFPLPLTEQHRQSVNGLLEKYGIDIKRLIAIAPGAKRALNRWPAEQFADVGRRFVQRGFQIALIGGAQDQIICREISEKIGSGSYDLSGKTTPLESCELLKRCRLLIANDSGVQHMAAAVNTRCISLFSCRDMPGKWHPYGSQNIVLRKWVQCCGCLLETCPYDNQCIKLIQASDVEEAAGGLTAWT